MRTPVVFPPPLGRYTQGFYTAQRGQSGTGLPPSSSFASFATLVLFDHSGSFTGVPRSFVDRAHGIRKYASYMKCNLMDFITASNLAQSRNELVELFTGYIGQFGYHQFTLALLAGTDVQEQSKNFGLMVNYPDEWLSHYRDEGFVEHDPVYANGCIPGNLFRWRDLARELMSPEARRVMDEAAEFGLRGGVGLSFLQPGARVVGFGISSPEKSPQDDPDTLSCLRLASFQCFEVYRSLDPLLEERAPEVSLSPREREVLLWASRGKNKGEISQILGISHSAVKRYCESLFSKLGVHKLPFALARAIHLGLVEP